MPDSATIWLILLSQTAPEPMHGSIVGAGVRQALGNDARVVVDERAEMPSDEDAALLADREKAVAVAEVRWATDDRSRAKIHVFLSADRGFYDHEVSFGAGDEVVERERAVGLLVGSMVRAAAEGALPPNPPAPAPPPKPPPPPPPPAPPPPPPRRVVAPPPPRARVLVDAGASGVVGIGGAGASAGPSAHLGVELAHRWVLRAGSAVRFGAIDGADATTRTVAIAAGGSFVPVTFGRREDVRLYLEVEGLLLHHAVTRDAPAEEHGRWLGGMNVFVTAGFRLTTSLEAYVAPGLEAALGSTPVVLDGRTVTTIPPLRAAAAAGLRLYF
jgi:hypothetical protein